MWKVASPVHPAEVIYSHTDNKAFAEILTAQEDTTEELLQIALKQNHTEGIKRQENEHPALAFIKFNTQQEYDNAAVEIWKVYPNANFFKKNLDARHKALKAQSLKEPGKIEKFVSDMGQIFYDARITTEKITGKEARVITQEVMNTIIEIRQLSESPAFKQAVSDVKEVTQQIPHMQSLLESAKDLIETLTSKFTAATSNFVYSLFDMSSFIKTVTKLVVLGVAAYKTTDKTLRLLLGTIAMFEIGAGRVLLESALSFIDSITGTHFLPSSQGTYWKIPKKELLEPQPTIIQLHESSTFQPAEFESQGLNDSENLLMTFIRCIGSMVSSRNLSEMKIDKIRMSRVVDSLRFVRDVPTLIETFIEYSNVALQYSMEWITGIPYVPTNDPVLHDDIVQFMFHAQAILSKITPKILSDPAQRQLVKNLKFNKDQIYLRLTQHSKYNSSYGLFYNVGRDIDDLYRSVCSHEITDEGRVVPLLIELQGLQGTGKSVITSAIVAAMLDLLGDEKFNGSHIYERKITDDFWSGYKGQFAVVFDDYMQVQDQEVLTKIIGEIIACHTSGAYPLNMPDLASKGATFMTSQMLILTCNTVDKVDYGQTFKLQLEAAFTSRRAFVIRVQPAPEVKPGAPYSPKNCVFQFIDTHTGQPVWSKDKWFDFDQMIKVVFHYYVNVTLKRGNIVKLINDAHYDVVGGIKAASQQPQVIKDFGEFDRTKTGKYSSNLLIQSMNALSLDVSKLDKKKGNAIEIFTQGRAEDMEEIFKNTPEAAHDALSYMLDVLSDDDLHNWLQIMIKNQKEEVKEEVKTANSFLERLKQKAVNSARRTFSSDSTLGSVIERIHNAFGSRIKQLSTWIDAHQHPLHSVIMGVGVAMVLFKVAHSLWTGQNLLGPTAADTFGVQSSEEKLVPRTRVQKARTRNYFAAKKMKLTVQGSKITEEEDISTQGHEQFFAVGQLVQKNLFSLGTNGNRQHAFFVNSRTFVTTRHFILRFLKNGELGIFRDDFPIRFYKKDDLEIITDNDHDRALVRIKDKTFPEQRDLRSHIPSEAEYPEVLVEGVGVVTLGGMYITSPADFVSGAKINDAIQPYELSLGIRVPIGLPTGTCTCPYLSLSDTVTKKILGIHASGNGQNTSFAVPITREFVEAIGQKTQGSNKKRNIQDEPPPVPIFDPSFIDQIEGNKVLEIVDKDHAVSSSGKTEWVRSNYVLPRYELNNQSPAMLSPKINPDGTVVDPRERALRKKMKPTFHIDNEYFPKIFQIYKDNMVRVLQPFILNDDQVLNGVSGSNLLGKVDRRKASGYPYSVNYWRREYGINVRGKLWAIDEDEKGHQTFTPFFKEIYDKADAKIRRGEDIDCVVQDTLKDEILPDEKVFEVGPDGKIWIGKTRIMGPVPLEVLLLQRKYFGAFFMNQLAQRRFHKGHTDIGINPHSLDPHEMFTYMLSYIKTHPRFLAGDISNQDGSIKEDLALKMLEAIEYYYQDSTEEERNARRILWKIVMIEVVHILGNIKYKTTSSPSGHFLTTIVNCMATVWGAMLGTYMATHDSDLTASMITRCRTLGDDHIIAVDPSEGISMQDIKAGMNALGFTYTGTDKNGPMPDYYDLEDTIYLQRHFVQDHNGYWHMALKKDVIESIGMYVRKNQDWREAMAQDFEAQQIEAFHWGEEYLEEIKAYQISMNENEMHGQVKFRKYYYDDLYNKFIDDAPFTQGDQDFSLDELKVAESQFMESYDELQIKYDLNHQRKLRRRKRTPISLNKDKIIHDEMYKKIVRIEAILEKDLQHVQQCLDLVRATIRNRAEIQEQDFSTQGDEDFVLPDHFSGNSLYDNEELDYSIVTDEEIAHALSMYNNRQQQHIQLLSHRNHCPEFAPNEEDRIYRIELDRHIARLTQERDWWCSEYLKLVELQKQQIEQFSQDIDNALDAADLYAQQLD